MAPQATRTFEGCFAGSTGLILDQASSALRATRSSLYEAANNGAAVDGGGANNLEGVVGAIAAEAMAPVTRDNDGVAAEPISAYHKVLTTVTNFKDGMPDVKKMTKDIAS